VLALIASGNSTTVAAVLTLMCRSSATGRVRRNGGSAKNGF
jgi:hypothetical protein